MFRRQDTYKDSNTDMTVIENSRKELFYMIELQTGKITFPKLGITLLPLLHHTDFITSFPKENILQI